MNVVLNNNNAHANGHQHSHAGAALEQVDGNGAAMIERHYSKITATMAAERLA